jgi:DNA-directed RNA polymerase subunit RPC12/RpoP
VLEISIRGRPSQRVQGGPQHESIEEGFQKGQSSAQAVIDSLSKHHAAPWRLCGIRIAAMWICIRCKTEFAEFTTEAEPNIDSFGLHFMCPACGRRNRLRSLGEDEEGFLRLEQIDEPE